MKRTFNSLAIASCFALGALTLVGCKDRHEHESTINNQPVTSGAASGALGVSEASGVSGAASGASATSGSGG